MSCSATSTLNWLRSCLVFIALLHATMFGQNGAGAGEASPPEELSLPLDGGRLVVRPLLDNAVRVRFIRGDKAEAPSLILTEAVTAPRCQLIEKARTHELVLPKLRVSVDKLTGSLSFYGAQGQRLLEELPGTRRCESNTVQGEATWSVSQSFDSPAAERLFGLGQFQDGFLNVRDLPRRLTQVNTQIAIPVVVSSRGFGLLWHNYGLTEFNAADTPIELSSGEGRGAETLVDVTTTEGTRRESRKDTVFSGHFSVKTAGRYAFFLDVGQKMARQWCVQIDGKRVVEFVNVWLPPTTSWFCDLSAGAHEVRVLGVQGDRPVMSFRASRECTEFRSPVADALDYVFFAGKGDEITEAYRRLSGAAPLPPIWALGYIHCRERYKTQEELLANAAGFRSRGLPLDVIVQDWQYWGRHGWNAMRFDERHYPDPAGMVRTLHTQGTRLMVSLWSKVDPQSQLGRDFAARGHYIRGTDWVDFFDPAAAAFYWSQVREKLLPLGIDAWWLDATEPENDDLIGRRVHTGAGERFRNVYPLFVCRTVYEGLRRDAPGRRAFILTRSAFPGQQRYGTATWSGDIGNDWETLRRQVAAGLNYSVTGLPWWTTDTGGFFRPGTGQYEDALFQERFLRWFQFSTFTPLLRVHGYQTDTELWRYGSAVERECRRWLGLRYRLLPYLYSEAARVTYSGTTLMRPLVMDFPSDPRALDVLHAYMFGPALLVAPVLEPGRVRWPVYLPATLGGWIDFWTGERSEGGGTLDAAAPLDRIPLQVRAGSILPLGPSVMNTAEARSDPLELRVYTGTDADFQLYEDEGNDTAYEKGERSTIDFHWDENQQTLSIGTRVGSFSGMSKERSFQVTWVRPGHGVGALPEAKPDAVVRYSGHPVLLHRPSP